MNLSKFFRSSSGSSSSSSRPHKVDRPPLGPGSSKVDYAYGLNTPGLSTSSGLTHSNHGDPPPYDPKDSPDLHDWATDLKMPLSKKTQTATAHFPAPSSIHKPAGSGGENALLVLLEFDIVIVLDDSYSMMIADNVYRQTRWSQAWEALEQLVREGIKYDKNGIQIHFLNKKRYDMKVKSVSDLDVLRKQAGEPDMAAHTPTGDVLEGLLRQYKKATGNKPGLQGVKKRVFLVITDGVPTDSPEEAIIDAAQFYQKNDFPSNQLGIQFIQVGNDSGATEYLEELDSDLPDKMCEDRRDMVDTVKSNGRNLNGDILVKALTGAINRMQDRVGERRSARQGSRS